MVVKPRNAAKLGAARQYCFGRDDPPPSRRADLQLAYRRQQILEGQKDRRASAQRALPQFHHMNENTITFIKGNCLFVQAKDRIPKPTGRSMNSSKQSRGI